MHSIAQLAAWYSPTGLRRGLLACVPAAAIWMTWALAAAHGILPDWASGSAAAALSPVTQESPACGCGVRL